VPERITKRALYRVVMGQYDPLGLLCAYTIQFKLLMRDLTGADGKPTGWDQEIPAAAAADFKRILADLKKLREVKFPRSVKPLEPVVGEPMLLVFGDGSLQASCALVYIRWEMADGSFQCRLVAGKTRVAPKNIRLTVPRMELQAALLAVRLAARVQTAMQMEFNDIRYFTDNTSVLGMIRSDSGSMVEFVGTRVSEIKSKSDPEKEWFWLETSRNLADMGTRKAVKPAEMGEGSDYQDGMEWMRRPEEEWGWGKYVNVKAGPVPAEELRKDMARITAAATVEESWPPYPPRISSLVKLKRIYGYVVWFLAALRK